MTNSSIGVDVDVGVGVKKSVNRRTNASSIDADNIQQDQTVLKRRGKGRAPNVPTKITLEPAQTKQRSTSQKKDSKALCKSGKIIQIEVGQIVLAKQKFSTPWPSQIKAIKKNSVVVYFFGDGRCGPVKKCDLYSIDCSKEIMISCIKRNITNYKKGILEMERILKVPDHLSITKFD